MSNKIKPLPPNKLHYKPVPPVQFDASLSHMKLCIKSLQNLTK